MPRTIVVSDLHGSSSLLDHALEHAGFGADDSLIVAGDLIDVGADDAVSLAESLGATILAGNHEVAAAIGLRITPQNAESLTRGPEFAERFTSGEWPLAIAAHGWLITHAGVSVALEDVIAGAKRDLDSLATELNRQFRDEVAHAVRDMPVSATGLSRFRLIGGEMGPLWFRPVDLVHIPSGLKQIVGHTPPEFFSAAQRAALESRGWRLVEPGGHRGEVIARYAVIEDGDARVVTVRS